MKSVKMDAHPAETPSAGTDDGHWFAPYALHARHTPEMASWLSLLRRTSTNLRFTLEPLYLPGQEGYDFCEEVLTSYDARMEEAALTVRCRLLAAYAEVYPERNIWYLEEILHLVGAIPLVGVGVTNAYAIVIAQDCGHSYVLDAIGTGPDEAIEALYRHVYAFLYGR